MPEEIIKLNKPLLSEHPKIIKAIEVYLKNGESLDSVEKFFIEECSCSYNKEDLKSFFKKIDASSLSKIKKEIAVINLQKKSLEMDSQASNRVIMIQEMAWNRMIDLYVGSKQPVTKDQKNLHTKQTREFCDLAKMYREYHQMRLEILGMGKTEEEAKSEMETFVASMLKEAVKSLSEFPDAQNKLSSLFNISVQRETSEDV